MTIRVFGIVGWKNSGKTTLTERLVAELTARGYVVSTVKHAHHGFDTDHEGTDSFRPRAAGALEVAIVSSRRWALMHEVRGDEPSLGDVLKRLSPCDLVLVEGYKREAHQKIEARRRAAKDTSRLSELDPTIVAVAADFPQTDEKLPVFGLDDITALADFVIDAAGLDALER